eukprot:scaffold121361_cov27-Phaeocystis_antarctica.AAC.1
MRCAFAAPPALPRRAGSPPCLLLGYSGTVQGSPPKSTFTVPFGFSTGGAPASLSPPQTSPRRATAAALPPSTPCTDPGGILPACCASP